MTAILGISGFEHDAAAALVVDGELVAAAQEERFTRLRHQGGFPHQAVDAVLDAAGLTPERLDHVAFQEKPLRAFGRALETWMAQAPLGFPAFVQSMPDWIGRRLRPGRVIRRGLRRRYRGPVRACPHHEAHAASAFHPSPFDDAAILVVDGVGEWATTSLGVGGGNKIRLDRTLPFPHSLGLLYDALTSFCGFPSLAGGQRMMNLAAYGEPRFAETMLQRLVRLKDDGSLRLDLSYFQVRDGRCTPGRKLETLFERPPRDPSAALTQGDMDLAASIQSVVEQALLRMANHLHQRTGLSNLCVAGGVAHNSVALGRLVRESPFERVWVQPAPGNAGAAIGAAYHHWHQGLNHQRLPRATDAQKGSKLGPLFATDTIQEYLRLERARYRRMDDEGELCDLVAGQLADGKVVGWFHGRMEFGSRALGARSILADPRVEGMQGRINRQIKFRESFRPFAPSVLREHAAAWFDLPEDREGPYMLFTTAIHPERQIAVADGDGLPGLERLDAVRSEIPAVTHVDYSARLQTVDGERDGRYHRLLTAFAARTGCPVLLNTSFNVRGEPIVCTPADALHCFLATEMDVLVLEDLVLEKEDQPNSLIPSRDAYLRQYELG